MNYIISQSLVAVNPLAESSSTFHPDAKRKLAAKRRQLTHAERRIEELDRLFKRIYEDRPKATLFTCAWRRGFSFLFRSDYKE